MSWASIASMTRGSGRADIALPHRADHFGRPTPAAVPEIEGMNER